MLDRDRDVRWKTRLQWLGLVLAVGVLTAALAPVLAKAFDVHRRGETRTVRFDVTDPDNDEPVATGTLSIPGDADEPATVQVGDQPAMALEDAEAVHTLLGTMIAAAPAPGSETAPGSDEPGDAGDDIPDSPPTGDTGSQDPPPDTPPADDAPPPGDGSPPDDTPAPEPQPEPTPQPEPQPAPEPEPGPAADTGMTIGMNMSPFSYWTAHWVFTDAFKQCRPWMSRNAGSNTGNKLEIETDANGWPILKRGQGTATTMFVDTGGHYQAGRYVATYDGDGIISYERDAKPVRGARGRVELAVNPTNDGIYIRIDKSNPDDPIRNFRLWLPGYENTDQLFHPLFLERLRPFKVIRFMNWQDINGSGVEKWEDRTTPEMYSQSVGGGVALEYMIALCNELDADPWFSMPHKADDDYVRHFAQMVKDQLHEDATIYVEYSNEVWNSKFGQSKWVRQLSQQTGRHFLDEWAHQAAADFRIWHEVFGDQKDRIVRVAASQASYPWRTKNLLEYLDGEFDAIAIAAYHGFSEKEADEMFGNKTTTEQVFEALHEEIDDNVSEYNTTAADFAKQWSEQTGRPIRLLAYEAGQHLTTNGKDKPYQGVYYAVQNNPEMYNVYRQNMNRFAEAGGDLFVAFHYIGPKNVWGSWGALEYQDQPIEDAPKYRALMDAAEGR